MSLVPFKFNASFQEWRDRFLGEVLSTLGLSPSWISESDEGKRGVEKTFQVPGHRDKILLEMSSNPVRLPGTQHPKVLLFHDLSVVRIAEGGLPEGMGGAECGFKASFRSGRDGRVCCLSVGKETTRLLRHHPNPVGRWLNFWTTLGQREDPSYSMEAGRMFYETGDDTVLTYRSVGLGVPIGAESSGSAGNLFDASDKYRWSLSADRRVVTLTSEKGAGAETVRVRLIEGFPAFGKTGQGENLDVIAGLRAIAQETPSIEIPGRRQKILTMGARILTGGKIPLSILAIVTCSLFFVKADT